MPNTHRQEKLGELIAAELSDTRSLDRFEVIDQLGSNVVRELAGKPHLPFRQDSLRMQWRKLFLDLIRELEIQGIFTSRVSFAQHCDRLAAIMIAVVKKEDDLAANLLLQPARGRDFGVEKSLRKKAARLLTEADNRLAHHCRAAAG